jgi:hypothetical protein
MDVACAFSTFVHDIGRSFFLARHKFNLKPPSIICQII